MKSTLKVLGIFLLCFVGLVACTSKDDSASKVQVELPDPLATRSVFWEDNVLLKAHLVFSEMLPEIVRSYLDPKRFGNIDQYSLIVISEEEKNLIYVVNFDGGGWALISGIFLEEGPILAYSFSGVFNPESIRSPEVAFWLESTKQFIAELIDDVFLDNTRSENQTCTEDSEIHSASRSFGDSYFWVQVPIDTTVATTTYSSVSPLLSTKWGQEYPWNYMCPTINGEQCLTGCVSVAYAQELYYLHDYLGEPTTLYHQIDRDSRKLLKTL